MMRLIGIFLLLLPLASPAQETRMGRLFLTPQERAALDIVRANSKPPEKIIKAGDSEDEGEELGATPVAPPPVVTLHGYVKRSDGKGTVWVNGQPVQEKATVKDVEIGRLQSKTNDVQIKLPGTGQTVKLKAGQSYDPASGKVGSLREIAPVTQPAAPVEPAKTTEKPAAEATKTDKAPSAEEKPATAATAPASAPPK